MSKKKESNKIILIYDDNPNAGEQPDADEYDIKIVSPSSPNSYSGNMAEKNRADDYLKKIDDSLEYLTETEAILIDHKMTDLNELRTQDILSKINNRFASISKKIHIYFFTGGDGLAGSEFEKLDKKYESLNFQRTIRNKPDSQWVIRSLEKNKSQTFLQFEKHYKNFPAPLRVIHKETGVVYYNDKWQGVIDKPDTNDFFDGNGAKTEIASYAELNPSEPEDEDNFNYPVTEIHSFIDDEINNQLSENNGKKCNYLVQFVQVVLPEKGAEIADILTKLQERFNNSKFDDDSLIELTYYHLDAFKIAEQRKFYTKSLAWDESQGWIQSFSRMPFPHEQVTTYSKVSDNERKLITIPNEKDETELFIPIYLNEKYTDLIATLVLKIKTNKNEYIKFKENKINRVDGSIYNAMLGIRHFLKDSSQNNWNQLHQKFDELQKIGHDKINDLLQRIVEVACEESKAEMVFLSTTSKVLFPHPTTKVAYGNCPRAEEIVSYLYQGFELNFEAPESVMPSVIAKDNQKSILWLKEHHATEFKNLIAAYEKGTGFSTDLDGGKEALISHLKKCKSILAMPVKVAGDVVAVFAMHSHKSYAFDLKMHDLLNFLVDCSENILNHYYRQSLQKTFVEGVAHEQRNMLEPLEYQVSQVKNGSPKLKMVADNLARSIHNIMIVYDNSGKDDQYLLKADIDFYKEICNAILVRESIETRRLGDRKVKFYFLEKKNYEQVMVKSNLLSIQLILGNILDNSVKYAAFDSIIQIKLEVDAETVTLIIENNTNLDQEKSKQKLKSAGYGYGVGLNVCERLSEWLDMKFMTNEKDDRFFCELTVKLSE